MPGHVAEQGGPGAHDLGAVGLEQAGDAGQPLLLQPDQLAHGIGHLGTAGISVTHSARGGSWEGGQGWGNVTVP